MSHQPGVIDGNPTRLPTRERWQTVHEARDLFRDQPVRRLQVCTAVQFPGGGWLARLVEGACPASLPFGAFILVVADIGAPASAPDGPDAGSDAAGLAHQ